MRAKLFIRCSTAATISATGRVTLALISEAAISKATIATARTAGFAGSMFVEFFCEGFRLCRIDDDNLIHAC